MAKPAHRTIAIIYSMFVLHVPYPDNYVACLIHLKLLKIVLIYCNITAKNCVNFTATNVVTMGTKSGYIHYSAPSMLEHISISSRMSIATYMFVVCKQHLECDH